MDQAAEVEIAGPLLWLPLLAAVLFALGALLLKRSTGWPVGVWRTTFVANLFTVVGFLLWVGLPTGVPEGASIWQPLVVAALFMTGQVTAIVALTRGDVSIAGPVMGLKILMVAVFVTLLADEPLAIDLWLAAGLSTVGVVLLNARATEGKYAHAGLSVGCGLAAAAAYGLFDVYVQMWAPRWGGAEFLPIVFLASGVLSLALIPFFEGPLTKIPRGAWRWLIAGGVLMTFQSLAIVSAIAVWGNAATANVVYSSRGLWSIAAVWLIGPWIGLHDEGLTRRVLAFRMVGAVLLIAAVALLLV